MLSALLRIQQLVRSTKYQVLCYEIDISQSITSF